jgi:transposase
MYRHGLPRERLGFWTRRLKEKSETRPALGFMPVKVAPAWPREDQISTKKL